MKIIAIMEWDIKERFFAFVEKMESRYVEER